MVEATPLVFRGHPYTLPPSQAYSRNSLDVLLVAAMQCSHPAIANHMSRLVPVSRCNRHAGVLFLPLPRVQPLIDFYRGQLQSRSLTTGEALVRTALGSAYRTARAGDATNKLTALEPSAAHTSVGGNPPVSFLTLNEPEMCLTALPETIQGVAIPPFVVAVNALAAALGFTEVRQLRPL